MPWKIVRLAPFLCLLCFPAAAGGTGSATGAPTPADEAAAEQVREHDGRLERRWVGTLRARASYPQGVSAGVGVQSGLLPEVYDCTTVCDYRGLSAVVEPGLWGGRVGLGYAVVVGEKKRNDFFLSNVFLGMGIRATLLRTWGDAPVTPSDQTLAGVEGSFTVARVNFTLGGFYRVSAGEDGRRWLLTGGLGWGF